MRKRRDKLLETLRVIEKHLAKNEKWLQKPEGKMHTFEKDMDEWDKGFLKNIDTFEKIMQEFEKRME